MIMVSGVVGYDIIQYHLLLHCVPKADMDYRIKGMINISKIEFPGIVTKVEVVSTHIF